MALIDWQQYVAESTLALGARIFQYTPALYTNYHQQKNKARNESRPGPVGSAVLFRFEERHFIVTAAHTFKRFDLKTVGLFYDQKFYHLDGGLRVSNPAIDTKDKIDIAIMELAPDYVGKLPSVFQFYDLNSFFIDHQDYEDMRYLIVGMPITRYRLKLRINKIEQTPFIFMTSRLASETTLKNMKMHNDHNLILEYTRKRVQETNTGKYITGPLINGMSGCGIWIIPNLVSHKGSDDLKFYPTAILTEYEPDYHCIAATRMRVVSESLRQVFNVPLPASRTLNITFQI